MLLFFVIPEGSGAEPSEDFFVGQLRAVKLDLNVHTADHDVPGDIEGDGILDPGLSRPPLGQLALEVLALVVGGVLGQQVLSAEDLSFRAQLSAVSARQLNANLEETTALGACAVEFEVRAQLSEAQLDNVHATAVHKAERVHMGRGQALVSGHHFGLGHLGQSPFLYLTLTL